MPVVQEQEAQAPAATRPRHLWLPFSIALVIRLVVVLLNYRDTPDAIYGYERFGWEMGWVARALATGHGFSSPFFPLSGPTALVPPLYPTLLSGIFRLFGVYSVTSAFVILAFNSLCSSLICINIYFIARHSFNERLARIAAWAWAIHPFAIYFSGNRVWDYALSGLLLSTAFRIAQHLQNRQRLAAWFGFGLLYGLTALSNPAVLSTFPFLLLWAVYKIHNRLAIRDIFQRRVLVAVFGVAVMIVPWSVRNARTLHVLSPVRDNFWLEFWAGNNGDTSDPNPAWAHPASNPAEMTTFLAAGETAYLQQKHVLAVDFLRHHPVFFAAITARRVIYFWTGFWSLSPAYRHAEPFQLPNVFFCGSLSALMLIGAVRFFRSNRSNRSNRIAAFPFLVLIFIFPTTYYISHPLMDYRQPIEPEITILVTYALFSSKARLESDCALRPVPPTWVTHTATLAAIASAQTEMGRLEESAHPHKHPASFYSYVLTEADCA